MAHGSIDPDKKAGNTMSQNNIRGTPKRQALLTQTVRWMPTLTAPVRAPGAQERLNGTWHGRGDHGAQHSFSDDQLEVFELGVGQAFSQQLQPSDAQKPTPGRSLGS